MPSFVISHASYSHRRFTVILMLSSVAVVASESAVPSVPVVASALLGPRLC